MHISYGQRTLPFFVIVVASFGNHRLAQMLSRRRFDSRIAGCLAPIMLIAVNKTRVLAVMDEKSKFI